MILGADIIKRVVAIELTNFQSRFECDLTPDDLKTITAGLIEIGGHFEQLRPEESCAIAINQPKVAALCFDRVWGLVASVPRGIGFGWETHIDIVTAAVLMFLSAKHGGSVQSNNDTPAEALYRREIMSKIERHIAFAYRRDGHKNVSPLFPTFEALDATYAQGNEAAVVAILDGLEVAKEEDLTWEQVLDFREDVDSRGEYRAFVHWLDKEMIGKSVSFLVDEVGERLFKYERALRKHSIQTITGALSQTLDARYLAGVGAIGAAMDFITHQPLWALSTGGLLVAGKTALAIAQVGLQREDVKDVHRDIAFVHSAKRIHHQ